MCVKHSKNSNIAFSKRITSEAKPEEDNKEKYRYIGLLLRSIEYQKIGLFKPK